MTNWHWFKTFEAIARHGSLLGASRHLGVSQSTVSRHLALLEELAGEPLLRREVPVKLTQRGVALLHAIEPMVSQALHAETALTQAPKLQGQVTVTTVGELVRWYLCDALPLFWKSYPNLELCLLASNQIQSLAAGTADISLRLAKPTQGDLVAKRLRTFRYGIFSHPTLVLDHQTPWVGLSGSLAHLPEQQIAQRLFEPRPPKLLVEDYDTLIQAVAQGQGVGLLPQARAQRLGLRERTASDVGSPQEIEMPTRAIWMVVHASKQRVPKVRAVMSWLEGVLSRP